MISWSHSRKQWSTKSNRCLFPSRRRGWRSTSTSLKISPLFLQILEGYTFLDDIHTLIIIKSSFDLSHHILGNYKSLPWMFRPFLVGFPYNQYHLRWPTCGLVAINCPLIISHRINKKTDSNSQEYLQVAGPSHCLGWESSFPTFMGI